MLPLPLHSTVLCGSIKWPLLLLPWRIQRRWFYEARRGEGRGEWGRGGGRLFSSGTRYKPRSTGATLFSFTRIVFAEFWQPLSHHHSIAKWQRWHGGCRVLSPHTGKFLELDFVKGLARSRAALPQMIEPFELVSSANGSAVCHTGGGMWSVTKHFIPGLCYWKLFHCFSAQTPHSNPSGLLASWKTQVLGFPWKSLHYVLYCSVLQNRNPASFSFPLAVFPPFCHFAREGAQYTCTQCFSPRFDVTE